MTVALTLIVKNEEEALARSLPTARGLIDSWVILDTGSTDGTMKVINDLLGDLPGELHKARWVDFATARNQLAELARQARTPSEWMLVADADMDIVYHEGTKDWLAGDPDPSVDAWLVPIIGGNTIWHRPSVIRTSFPWRWVGPVHEYLDTSESITRTLLGLELRHFGGDEGGFRGDPDKWLRYLEMLEPGANAGDPRAVYYYAQTLQIIGRVEDAIIQWERRSEMGDWEEEAWHAAYLAARFRRDVPALLACHERRPWRPEPLRWAARFVTEDGHRDDILFVESE